MTNNMLSVFAPYDESLIKEIPTNNAQDLEHALATAYSLAGNHPTKLPRADIILILERAANLVESKAEAFAVEAAREGGKPLIDSRVELTRAVQGIREAARSINQIIGHEIPMNLNTASSGRKAFTFREPIGVVAAISAFNHPFNLIVHQVIPALAVGCPVIVKPAQTTPLSCYNLVNTLYEAGLPKEWCQVLNVGRDLAEKLVSDPRISFLTFIGSARVGWYLRSKLSPGVHCALEHGGAAPVIIDKSADIIDAIPLLAKGGFYHAGQVCVSVQRIFVHHDLLNQLCQGLVDAAKNLIVGDPLSDQTHIGPLILPKEVDRVDEWVKEAVNHGAELISGGHKIGKTCYAPTILLNPSKDSRVSTEEIFGPVVCIYPYKDRLDAINLANALPLSFQASVFAKDIDVIWDTVTRLSAAAVMVNDHTAFRVDWMPFGGRKHSGMGVGGILPTMLEMTQEKLMVFRSPFLAI